MHKALASLAVITIAWFVGSTYWYVCNIQYLCGKVQSPAAITTQAANIDNVTSPGTQKTPQDITQNAQIEQVTVPSTRPTVAPSDNTMISINPDERITLHFLPDSTEFTGQENVQTLITSTVMYLKQHPETRIRVDGYTADVGPNYGDCDWMSRVRAERVQDLLIQAGIDEGRIVTMANAAANPVGDNTTPDGMAMNRRATITILN